MKILLFTSCLVFNLFVQANAQVNCDDYKIVSIFDIPPTPITPGGNFFLLLLTLEEDNLSNIDNYANLFFIDHLGDTISIPTGPSSTLPRYSSDTIPYILKVNSASSNQDFPDEFDGKLIIIHATQLLCEVNYSNLSTNTSRIDTDFKINVYPNPFVDNINIDSEKRIESILMLNSGGRIVDKFYTDSDHYEMRLKNLSTGSYLIIIQFESGKTETHKVIKL